MKQVLEHNTVCPHCGAPMKPAARGVEPARELDAAALRYDIEAVAAEAADERAYDETAKVRVTQQDIRKLLEKRMKVAK